MKPYPQISVSIKEKLNYGICLSDGVIPEYIGGEKALERLLESRFKDALFEYLKREGLIEIYGVEDYFNNLTPPQA